MASASIAGQHLPTPATQQESVVEESEEEEIITVDDERPQAPPVVDKRTAMTKTGSDGTIRIRRDRLQPNGAATSATEAPCCSSGSKVEENEKVVGVFSRVESLNLPVEVAFLLCFFRQRLPPHALQQLFAIREHDDSLERVHTGGFAHLDVVRRFATATGDFKCDQGASISERMICTYEARRVTVGNPASCSAPA